MELKERYGKKGSLKISLINEAIDNASHVTSDLDVLLAHHQIQSNHPVWILPHDTDVDDTVTDVLTRFCDVPDKEAGDVLKAIRRRVTLETPIDASHVSQETLIGCGLTAAQADQFTESAAWIAVQKWLQNRAGQE